MNGLKYRMLWVDDAIDTFKNVDIDENFKRYLIDMGFQPEIVTRESPIEALSLLREDKKFDLILSDYNLSEDEGGDSLIKRIRDGNIFTEILFYSNKPGFIEQAKKLYQDRVSFFASTTDVKFKLFFEKVCHLINLTVSKLHELGNMRGLVMAETSELDVMIEDILVEVEKSGACDLPALRRYMDSILDANLKDRIKAIEKSTTMGCAEVLRNKGLFDSYKRARVLNKYFKLSGLSGKEDIYNDFHEKYNKDVIAIRNDLAHAKSGRIDGNECLIVYDKNGVNHCHYDHEKCVDVRKKLIKYSRMLADIKDGMDKG